MDIRNIWAGIKPYVQNLIKGSIAITGHTQNTDTVLAQGTVNEVTAVEAREHIDNRNNPHEVDESKWKKIEALSQFRVPTELEWLNEAGTWVSGNSVGAYESILKLTMGGYRHNEENFLYNVGSGGYYWCETVGGTDNHASKVFIINSASIETDLYSRSFGYSVRLIKEGIYTSETYQSETIIIDGLEYKTVFNPTTGRIWLDRNLGAIQIGTSQIDTYAYGWLYQWGRLSDGHQLRDSNITYIQSTEDNPNHGDYVLNYNDWRNPFNNDLWQGIEGINNPGIIEELEPIKAGLQVDAKHIKNLPESSQDITKQQIIDTLEYTPADEVALNEHAEDTTYHIVDPERNRWNYNLEVITSLTPPMYKQTGESLESDKVAWINPLNMKLYMYKVQDENAIWVQVNPLYESPGSIVSYTANGVITSISDGVIFNTNVFIVPLGITEFTFKDDSKDYRFTYTITAWILHLDYLMDSLVVGYSLDGNANDIKGLVNGTATDVTWPDSMTGFGKAASFNGTSSVISTPNTNLNLNTNKLMSMSCWIYPTSNGQTYASVIFAQNSIDTDNSQSVGFALQSTGKVRFRIESSAGTTHTFEFTNSISLNEWSHIMICWDNDQIKFYVNGIYDKMETMTSIRDVEKQIMIGSALNASAPSRRFTGLIDDCRIYNISLTEQEREYIINNPL